SPQVLSTELRGKLAAITHVPADPYEKKAELLGELGQLAPETLLAAVQCEERRQVAIRVQRVDDDARPDPGKGDDKWIANPYVAPQDSSREYSTRAGRLVYGQETISNAKNPPSNTVAATNLGRLSPNGEQWMRPWLHQKSREEVVSIGPWNGM